MANNKYMSDIANNIDFNTNINPNTMFTDELFASAGLYSREEIEWAKYNAFSRFGRILNPHERLNDSREYLFFIKPDLHIVDPESGGMKINEQLSDNWLLKDLVKNYPSVISQLQYSAPYGGKSSPFCNLLSFGVSSNLDMPSIELKTMDTPANMFGLSMDYLQDGAESNYNPSFSLEFMDTKEMEIFNFFRGYAEYQTERLSGKVTPPSIHNYTFKKRLHNTMGIYKFIVDDTDIIRFFAYIYGVIPTSVPREAFSDPNFAEGLTFTINFKSVYVTDSNPVILMEFNNKMAPLIAGKQELKTTLRGPDNLSCMINGKLPVGARVGAETVPIKGGGIRTKYKLKWYA